MAVAKQPSQHAPWGEYAPNYASMDADTFLQLPHVEGWTFELYQGRVIRMPGPGFTHMGIQGRLMRVLGNFLDAHALGEIYGTGCYILPMPDGREDVLCPDISYILPQRLSPPPRRGSYLALAPDLVCEIASTPNDSHPDINRRVAIFLEAGVRLVWAVWPNTKTIEVWRPSQKQQPITILHETDLLDGLDVLPGFTCPVKQLF